MITLTLPRPGSAASSQSPPVRFNFPFFRQQSGLSSAPVPSSSGIRLTTVAPAVPVVPVQAPVTVPTEKARMEAVAVLAKAELKSVLARLQSCTDPGEKGRLVLQIRELRE